MIDEAWFSYEGVWHIHDEGSKARCRLELLNDPPLVHPSVEDGLPPNPCRSCLLAWGMDQVEDEPLDEAKARGYLPGDLVLEE